MGTVAAAAIGARTKNGAENADAEGQSDTPTDHRSADSGIRTIMGSRTGAPDFVCTFCIVLKVVLGLDCRGNAQESNEKERDCLFCHNVMLSHKF